MITDGDFTYALTASHVLDGHRLARVRFWIELGRDSHNEIAILMNFATRTSGATFIVVGLETLVEPEE